MTAPEQLDFDGGSVPHPAPRPRLLTSRQRELMRFIRLRSVFVETIPTREIRPFYVDASGAMRRLEAMGLVERAGRGRWRAP